MRKNVKENVCIYIVYVCITESLCCTAVVNTVIQLYFDRKKKEKHSIS